MTSTKTTLKATARIAALAAFGLGIVTTFAAAQSAQKEPLGSHFEVGSGLRYDFNPEQTAGGNNTRLGLNSTVDYKLNWATNTTLLDLALGADLYLGSGTQGFNDPYLNLNFGHESARTRLTSKLSYVESDVSSAAYAGASDGSLDIGAGSGRVVQSGLSLGFEGGIDTPLSYALNGAFNGVDFSNATGTGFTDNTTSRADAKLRARLSAMTSVILDGHIENYQLDDALETERDTQLIRLSIEQRVDRITMARLSVGHRNIDFSDTSGTTSASGTTLTGSLLREHNGGHSVLRYNRDIDRSGTSQTLRFTRKSTMKTGHFEWTLGVAETSLSNLEMIGDLAYRVDMKDDAFGFKLSRAVRINDDSDHELSHKASLLFDHALDDNSGLGVNLTAAAISAPSGDDTSFDARIAYRRDLDRNLGLETGVRLRVLDEASSDSAVSGSVFFTLKRSFSTK